MKKGLLLFILIFTCMIFIHYYISDFSISYKVNKHTIKQTYKNGRLYYEIDGIYNFDIYSSRPLNKAKINKISEINGEDFKCIYPYINKKDTYPICYQGDTLVDYNLIESELLDIYKTKNIDIEKPNTTFKYYNNLDNNTYIALWNYNGYKIMNDKNSYEVTLFKEERYDNSLSYMKDGIIYMPDYDQEHEYNKIVTLNIENSKKDVIDLNYKIDYDSYIVGSVDNKIYIFDNKYSVLYEYNIKKQKLTIKSNSESGYVKYNGNKFVSCSKSEYKIDKISFDIKKSLYTYEYNNKLYKTMNDNNNIKTIIQNEEVLIIHEYKNDVYYVLEDYLYKYNPLFGSEKIIYFYELTFNSDSTIYIYNK